MDTGSKPSDADGDGYGASVDCDDESSAIHPGADEVCDGLDNDCSGSADDAAVDAGTWYTDADGDGSGADTTTACTQPVGTSAEGGDCDDEDSAVNPDAVEVCGGGDEDCDGEVDEAGADGETARYRDADGDGWGAGSAVLACVAPEGRVAVGEDCDDGEAAVHPGAEEPDCTDPIDYDCDGQTAYADADSDGWAACVECDDGDPAISPDAVETCNGLDDDCDADVDEVGAADEGTWYPDGDGDGWGDDSLALLGCEAPEGYLATGGDCDDTDASLSPDTAWYGDGDGDGWGAGSATYACEEPSGRVRVDGDCDDRDPAISPGAVEVCDAGDTDEDCDGLVDDEDVALGGGTWNVDADGDGWGGSGTVTACDAGDGRSSRSGDCDDGDASVFPGAVEVCDALDTDEDCDGLADDADIGVSAATRSTWFGDGDADGYGEAADNRRACDAPAGYVDNADDCDDARSDVSPAGSERCDASDTDEDCDGLSDDEDPTVALGDKLTFYQDLDRDGYGDATVASSRCDATAGWTADYSDCDDLHGGANPAGTETCATSYDDDCDGATNEVAAIACTTWYADADGDGWGGGDSRCQCAADAAYAVRAGGDCEDGDSSVSPVASERCDGVDQDCDGVSDDGMSLYYPDGDGDGWGDASVTGACSAFPGSVTSGGDCDDGDAAVSPEAQEICDPLDIDEDCDGLADDADGDVVGTTSWYTDRDSDGYGQGPPVDACGASSGRAAVDGDCNDSNAAVNPGVSETYGDAVDDDCDGSTAPSRSYCSPIQVPDLYPDIDTAVDTYHLTEICLGEGSFSWNNAFWTDWAVDLRGQGMGVTTVVPDSGNVYGSAEDLTVEGDAYIKYIDVTLTRVEITGSVTVYGTSTADYGDRAAVLNECIVRDGIMASANHGDSDIDVSNSYVTNSSRALTSDSWYSGDVASIRCYGCTVEGEVYVWGSRSGSRSEVLFYNSVYDAADTTVYSYGTISAYDSADTLDDLDMSYEPPRPTGALLDAGGSYGLVTDFWGVSRGSPPDLGAVEVP